MNLLKQNWIKIGLGVLVLATMFFLKLNDNLFGTALIKKPNLPEVSPTSSAIEPSPLQTAEFKLSGLWKNSVVIKDALDKDILFNLYGAREQVFEVIDGMEDCSSNIGNRQFYGYYLVKTFKDGEELDAQSVSFNPDMFYGAPSKLSYAFYDPNYLHSNNVLQFVSGDNHAHDGLRLIKLAGIEEPFVGLYQYISCREEMVRLYKLGQNGKIIPILFKNEKGKTTPFHIINSRGIINVKNGQFRFCTWSPWEEAAGTFCEVFDYRQNEFSYVRTDHYHDPIDYETGQLRPL